MPRGIGSRHEDLRSLLRAMPVPSLIVTRVGGALTITGHNEAAARITGGAVAALVGRRLEDAYAHEPHVCEDAIAALEAGEAVVREGPLRLASTGEDRVARTHAVPVGEETLVLHIEDLTPQARAESFARSVVESIDDGLVAVELDGRTAFANQRAAEILGVPLEHLYTPRPWWEQIDAVREDGGPVNGPDAPGVRVLWGETAVRDVVQRLRRPDGRAVWISANYSALRDRDRVRGLVVSFRDITERRRAIERFERSFEDAPIGMALLRLDGTFERVNAALAMMVGRAPSAVEAMSWAEIVAPQDRAQVDAVLSALRSGGDPPERIEQRLITAAGTAVDVVHTMSVVRDAAGAGEFAVCQCLDVSARRQYEAELERRALHDPLTDLPNRALFADRLQQALDRLERTGCAVAVVFLDLDEFKRVNDSLGHGVGDRVLVETGRRLSSVLRAGDTLCRFGGDEFVMLCEDLPADGAGEAAQAVGERLLGQIAGEPYTVSPAPVHLRASVGIAIAFPGAAGSVDRLVSESDAAMYRAKRRGGGRTEVARDETTLAARRLALESDLREALRSDTGLWLAYQPIIDLQSGGMVGLEALLRWERPGHGAVFPGEIIPVAEQSGLIVELGEWVMQRAVADLAGRAGLGDAYVAVNLGARQFASAELAPQLRACLEDHGVEPSRVSLEITESVAMGDAEGALATMRALKEVGVRIAIDDFGTGFSSLGYLKRFPADTVKIDREFIVDVATPSEDRAIVEAVLSMADALDLDVVAEGVETTDQRDALCDLGCRRAQGFLFARPAPLADAVAGG